MTFREFGGVKRCRRGKVKESAAKKAEPGSNGAAVKRANAVTPLRK
jgi:hypothetical protein